MPAHGVNGIVVIDPEKDAAEAPRSLPDRVPLIVMGGGLDAVSSTVRLDGCASSRKAVGHLLDPGHHTVRHPSGPPR